MKRDLRFDSKVNDPKNIAIIHPDLGIGGAERLIVDVGLGLQELHHKVTVYTSHCDKSHAFEEVANGTLDVVVYGDFLPRNIFGKFTIFCATIRQIYLVLKLLFLTKSSYDFYVIDSLAACLPIIWIYNIFFKSRKQFSKILFYCHFPDQKLAQKGGIVKKLYRILFDSYEEFCFFFAKKVYVNSNFTKSIFLETFKVLQKLPFYTDPRVVYPCIDETIHNDEELDQQIQVKFADHKYFLSVNRFERKKNVGLAVEAFNKLLESQPQNKSAFKLLIAGGYDNLVSENVEYLKELSKLASDAGLKYLVFKDYKDFLKLDSSSLDFIDTQVVFLPNISTDLRNSLMKYAEMLLYTPSFEHFGIVPIEAIKYNTLVLSVNNGGPKETSLPLDDDKEGIKTDKIEITNYDGTGFTKPNDAKVWANVLERVAKLTPSEKEKLQNNGEAIIEKLYTRKVLRETINKDIVGLSKNETELQFQESQRTVYSLLVVLLFPVFAGIFAYYYFTRWVLAVCDIV